MQRLQFHPVWERTLPIAEKTAYERFFHETAKHQMNNIIPYIITEKRLGGLVTTVFIQNFLSLPLQLDQTTVCVKTKDDQCVASYSFSPHLHINPNSSMPWSFVFPPEACVQPIPSLLNVSISLDE